MRKIGLLGPEGTFCEVALNKYLNHVNLKEIDINFYQTISKVSNHINDNDLTILPLENSLDGYVQETLDGLLYNGKLITCDLVIPINFAFVSFEKEISNVKKIYVQFKAYGQCLDFINNNDFSVYKCENNVESLESLLKDKESCGAIVPMHLVDDRFNDGLVIKNVSDKVNNYTRFIVLDSVPLLENEEGKCSMMLCAKSDKPGILSNALKTFQVYDINLTCIMSRPTKNELGTYHFYVEFDNATKAKIINVKENLEKENDFEVKILGIYSRI